MSSSLHDHTEYSLLDGYSSPRDYLKRAREIGLKAFAVTEHGNMYSWVYFDKIKAEYPDIKILYGVEIYECFDMDIKDSESKYFHLIIIAKDEIGRKILNKIVTKSNFKGFYYKPRVDLNTFTKEDGEHLIVSSACLASKLARESDYNQCVSYIEEYKKIFPYFYLEMQSHKSIDQEIYNQKLLQLSKNTNTPFIITTDSHAATKEDLYYQGRHVQIAQDRETMSESYDGCYLQTDEEIHSVMDNQVGYDNVVIGLENTDKIADMCDVVNMPFQKPQLPTFPLPNGFKNNYEYLRHLCLEGWNKRKFNVLSKNAIKIREERLEYELSVIHEMGFDGYFLIVWDFISWAKNNNIMTGAGRGSCAGSLVCYLLEITELDPITYNLIFERFLNVERISMPDTDSDFGEREPVVNYIIDKYGVDKVCQVINYSYITPILAIKDVGRVLKIPYVITDKISKKFSYETFQECMDNNPNIYEQYKSKTDDEFNEKLKDLFNIASHLSGKLRQVSIHAGGVGIVDTNIDDYMGMKLGSKGEHVIQVDKRIIEEIGIIKFDLLGVQTLNLVKQVLIDANIDEWEINVNNPKFITDKKAYKLLGSAKTNGVFQVESAGMKDLLLRLKPDNLEDLSALIALFRPDSMQFVEPYIKNKHIDTSEIEYIHDDMKPILENTYGCMIYQEQLLDIVRRFGGRTYGGADKFRKAIGKKDVKLVKTESEKLYNEILLQGYSKEIAFMVSDDMSHKGGLR
jgi:DNA polymerase-3 subunit alpha